MDTTVYIHSNVSCKIHKSQKSNKLRKRFPCKVSDIHVYLNRLNVD